MIDRWKFLATASLAAAMGVMPSPWAQGKAPRPLSILILGGTRFIGVEMTELALKRGHQLTFFNRGRTNADLFPDIERIKGDRNGDVVNESIRAARDLAKPTPPPRAIWAPAPFLAAQKVEGWSDMPVWVDAKGDEAAFASTSAGRAIKAGLKITPMRKTCRDTLAWHLTRPAAEQEKLRSGIAPEREKEVLGALRESLKNFSEIARRGQEPGRASEGVWGILTAPCHFALSPAIASPQACIERAREMPMMRGGDVGRS